MKTIRRRRAVRGRAMSAALLLAGILALAFPAVLLQAQEAPGGAGAPPAAAPDAPAAAPAPAAPAGGDAPAPPPEGDKPPETLLELIVAGKAMMIPILLCSLIALGIAFERMVSLRRDVVAPPGFLGKLKAALGESGRPDVDRGLEFCRSQKAPVAAIYRAGLSRLSRGLEAVEKAIEDAGGREVDKMKRSLRPLSSIANIATLLGLLGTVYGLITAFGAAAQQTVGKAQMLAEGIYVALVTTAAGLTVAIPTLVLYLWFCARVDKIVDSIDAEMTDFVEFAVDRPGAPGAGSAAAAPAGAVGAAAEGGIR
jgi:biopolymer transport protein ExbB